ncbi:MAG: hypothetical protein AAFN80_17210, partial [Pseudomonadota bacterium]
PTRVKQPLVLDSQTVTLSADCESDNPLISHLQRMATTRLNCRIGRMKPMAASGRLIRTGRLWLSDAAPTPTAVVRTVRFRLLQWSLSHDLHASVVEL